MGVRRQRTRFQKDTLKELSKFWTTSKGKCDKKGEQAPCPPPYKEQLEKDNVLRIWWLCDLDPDYKTMSASAMDHNTSALVARLAHADLLVVHISRIKE